jgi:hypothetical protein
MDARFTTSSHARDPRESFVAFVDAFRAQSGSISGGAGSTLVRGRSAGPQSVVKKLGIESFF